MNNKTNVNSFNEKEVKFVIITGLSGAGRSQAMRSFEDMGYFCVDNLPSIFIPKFAELCFKTTGQISRIALVIDIRGGGFFDDLQESLKILKEMGFPYEILFLDATDSTLIRRFKESRRSHPLAPLDRIGDGIKKEREKIEYLKSKSHHIIDTTNLTPGQLKKEIYNRFILEKPSEKIIITILSFGFKHGLPLDADMVFDVRFIPNPHYIDELKSFSGNDEKVYEYVLKWTTTKIFLDKLEEMLEFLLPNYIKEGKNNLVIGIGCTGGRHRSVAISRELTKRLKKKRYSSKVEHRDIYYEGDEVDH